MFKISKEFTSELLKKAGENPRKRAHFNIHTDYNEPVQRLCIGLKKGTYIRPHRHLGDNAWEMFVLLKGEVVILTFNDDGEVLSRTELSIISQELGIELKPNTWHMVFPVTSDAVIFEIKEGPYTPKTKCDFALWAPEEGREVSTFLKWAQTALLGDKYS